ncbi:hypothetical protein KP626_00815 [Christensenella sp. MSJ-20]|uniref:hypothetical protein n=1 Tax=Christensenella sp. MSJ-20 TaxID=2841518 RepID=UPI001C76A933|nr:hypothetical protein KP626_00815 [Christensenella sp. MSJ-20]
MKKWMLMILLLLLVLPFQMAYAAPVNEEEDLPLILYEIEMAIVARTAEMHGQYVSVAGTANELTKEGMCLYFDNPDFIFDIKENAVWLDRSFIDAGGVDVPISEGEETLSRTFLAEGYVNLNNRGPGGRYAATIQAEPVTEPFLGDATRTGGLGGDQREDAVEVSIFRLMANIWEYQGKWVKTQGIWRLSSQSTESYDVTYCFKPFISSGVPSIEFLRDTQESTPIFYDLLPFIENRDERLMSKIAPIAAEVTGKVVLAEYPWKKQIEFEEIMRIRLHPLRKQELQQEKKGGVQ